MYVYSLIVLYAGKLSCCITPTLHCKWKFVPHSIWNLLLLFAYHHIWVALNMYANMLNRLKNYFGIENIFVEFSIHKMKLFKNTISIHNDKWFRFDKCKHNANKIKCNLSNLNNIYWNCFTIEQNLKTDSQLNEKQIFYIFPLHSFNINKHHLLPRALFQNGNLIHASYA